jgi:hypothetical protein
VLPVTPTLVTKFVANEVNAASEAAASSDGSELAPFAALPLGSLLTAEVAGTQAETPTHVLRTNTMPPLLGRPGIRLFETDAKATYCPVVLVEGPTVS